MQDATNINKFVIELVQEITKGQWEHGTMGFLHTSCKILHDAQVWPPTPDGICTEITATYNYLIVRINCLMCDYKLVSSCFDESKTNKVISATLNRVYWCITGSDTIDDCSDESICQKIMKIVKVLENPVFHFKCLTILGRLLLLMTAMSLYKRLLHGSCQEIISCLLKFIEMAGVPVLKESCHFHHSLLFASPSHGNTIEVEENVTTVTVEDVVCLILAAYQQPIKHLRMEHKGWTWLYAGMECRNFMLDKSHALAMQKLQVVLKDCVDPQHKSRLLCLFADCYFHMDCPQLSIQTYRDALQTDPRHFSIMHRLSLVYQSLDLPELELESLNLCVMALADEERKKEDTIPVMDLDELVWSIVPPILDVSYIVAKATFAKRCLQLKRYPEAAEQYSSLIGMLLKEDMFLKFEKHEMNQELNIAEIIVEAAEVLVITRQYQDCIKLCDNTQPSLSANDSIAKNSQLVGESLIKSISPENSQSDIFNLLDDSQSLKSSDPLSFPNKRLNLSKGDNHSSADLSVSFQKSRKRMRSGDFSREGNREDVNESSNDSILTRLLLCKADALVLSQGFTDDAISCLQQSLDILIHHPPLTNNKPNADESVTHPPHSKRQRISSDGKSMCRQGLDLDQSDLSESSSSDWPRLLIGTALRMATASYKRKRFSSVINSCRVVEQLDSGNIDAAYLKALVMSENDGFQREAIVAWLNLRGVSYLDDRNELEKTIRRLQQTSLENNESKWWNWNERDFQDLDVKCLQLLLEFNNDISK